MKADLTKRIITSMTWMIETLKVQEDDIRDPMGMGGTGGYSPDLEESMVVLRLLQQGDEELFDNPTFEQGKEQICKDIAIAIGLTEEQGSEFFHHFNAQGWKQGNGLPIIDLRSAMVKWKNRQYRFEDDDSPAPRMGCTGPTPRELDMQARGENA